MIVSKIENARLSLAWSVLDTRYPGAKKPAIQYCADGDGMVIVRETSEGLKLFDQGDFVRTFSARDTIGALVAAEFYLKNMGYGHLFGED